MSAAATYDARWVHSRLTRAHRWAKISAAVAAVIAVIVAAYGIRSGEAAFAVSSTALFSAVFLLGTLWQWRLVSSYAAAPGTLGRASWKSAMALLWTVLGAVVAIIAAQIAFFRDDASVRGFQFGLLLVALLFAPPLGSLLDASRVHTFLTEGAGQFPGEDDHPDIQQARRRLTRARLGAALSLAFAVGALIILTVIGLRSSWAPPEMALLATSAAVILASGVWQLRLVTSHAAEPYGLGRASRKKALTLLWSTLGAHGVITMAAMVAAVVTGEPTFVPVYGFAVSGLALAIPCGALLDASRVATLITGR